VANDTGRYRLFNFAKGCRQRYKQKSIPTNKPLNFTVRPYSPEGRIYEMCCNKGFPVIVDVIAKEDASMVK